MKETTTVETLTKMLLLLQEPEPVTMMRGVSFPTDQGWWALRVLDPSVVNLLLLSAPVVRYKLSDIIFMGRSTSSASRTGLKSSSQTSSSFQKTTSAWLSTLSFPFHLSSLLRLRVPKPKVLGAELYKRRLLSGSLPHEPA